MERRYTAIVLGKIETGETDRIYTLYTKEQGKVRAVAKGVRKPEARLASQLETPVLSQVTVVGVRGLPKIAGAVLEEGFLSLRSDFDGLRRALEALAFLERLVDLDEPDEETFFLTVEYLQLADMLSALKNEHSVRLVTKPSF
ncbi:MAG: DNA repair protein RecO [Candidatus Moraniibacteriota bacterium]